MVYGELGCTCSIVLSLGDQVIKFESTKSGHFISGLYFTLSPLLKLQITYAPPSPPRFISLLPPPPFLAIHCTNIENLIKGSSNWYQTYMYKKSLLCLDYSPSPLHSYLYSLDSSSIAWSLYKNQIYRVKNWQTDWATFVL